MPQLSIILAVRHNHIERQINLSNEVIQCVDVGINKINQNSKFSTSVDKRTEIETYPNLIAQKKVFMIKRDMPPAKKVYI